MNTLTNLENLIGEKFDRDEIICCFESEEQIIVNKSENNGYDYIAYENTRESEQYLFNVDSNNIITKVWQA